MSFEVNVRKVDSSEAFLDFDDIEHGDLFRDGDGDLHLKINDGCIFIDGGSLTLFDADDIKTLPMKGETYMEKCTYVAGRVEINVIFD